MAQTAQPMAQPTPRQRILFSEIVRNYSSALKKLAESQKKKADTEVTWSWVCTELLSLLMQYPGGVSEAITMTELSERWQEQGRSNDLARASSVFTPMRQLLRRDLLSQGGAVVIEGLVKGIEGGNGLPVVLLLADDSIEDQPIGMYLHSRFHGLCMGPAPVLRAGMKLRLSNCAVHRAPKSSGLPPRSLPSEELAVVCGDVSEARALLGPQQLLTASQLLGMRMEAEDCRLLDGVLHAVVANVGPLQASIDSEHGISARSGKWRCMWLADVEGGECSGPGILLRLLDQQVVYGDMLRCGEHVLIRQPLLTTTLGPDMVTCLEVSAESLVVVVPKDGAVDEMMNKAKEQGRQIGIDASCTVSATAAHRPSHAGAVVGLLTSIELRVEQQQRSLLLHIMDGVGVEYRVTALLCLSSRNSLLSMRTGHTIVATGLVITDTRQPAQGSLEAPSPQAIFHCSWAEGPGALIVSLSALPSLLYSPAFHANRVSLASLSQASALQLSCCHPALCEVSLASPPSILVRRVHAPCQKSLRRASFGFEDVFGGDEAGAASQSRAADETSSPSQPEYMATDNKSSLWTCAFCQSECGSFATTPVLEARLEITDAAGPKERATAQGDAVATLVGVTALEWYGMEGAAQEARLKALQGARLLVSIFIERNFVEPHCPSEQPLRIAMLRCLDQ